MLSKAQIRQKTLARRRSLDQEERANLEDAVRRHIAISPLFTDAFVIAIYIPVHGEVDLLPLWNASDKTIVFPEVEGDRLVFCPAKSLSDFTQGSFGIAEPHNSQPIPMMDIDLILVPGLVFDRYGYRVGYGKGYYDRLIKAYPNVITIGVCLDEFFIERLPSEPWDARVNFVATQLGIFKTECEVL
jgi:5-formyltetrahydrofolate cyclo-ligase